jgi:hypothetical protein
VRLTPRYGRGNRHIATRERYRTSMFAVKLSILADFGSQVLNLLPQHVYLSALG